MRQIANNVYIPVLKDLVEEGKEVSMMISGSSMNPFLIHQRDYILMKKPEEELKAGDMAIYEILSRNCSPMSYYLFLNMLCL